MRSRVLENRDRAEQQARDNRHGEGEQQHGEIDRDVVEPRQVAWRKRDQRAHGGRRETQARGTAHQAEDDAFGEQLVGDASATGAERRAHRQLLLTSFGAHQQQVRHIRAGDQQHHADRAHQHPQHRSDVADQIVLQQAESRLQLRVIEHLGAEAGECGKAAEADGNQTRDLGGRLIERRARFQACHAGEAEVAQVCVCAIELEREDHRRLLVEEPECIRQDADDLVRFAVEQDAAANHRWIRTEARTPVAGHQDHRICGT